MDTKKLLGNLCEAHNRKTGTSFSQREFIKALLGLIKIEDIEAAYAERDILRHQIFTCEGPHFMIDLARCRWDVTITGRAHQEPVAIELTAFPHGHKEVAVYSTPSVKNPDGLPVRVDGAHALNESLPHLLQLLCKVFPKYELRCRDFIWDDAHFLACVDAGSPEYDRLKERIRRVVDAFRIAVDENAAYQWLMEFQRDELSKRDPFIRERIDHVVSDDGSVRWFIEAPVAQDRKTPHFRMSCLVNGGDPGSTAKLYGSDGSVSPPFRMVHAVNDSLPALVKLMRRNFPQIVDELMPLLITGDAVLTSKDS